MTKDDQIKLVRDLTESVVGEIIDKIRADRVPANWNGFELRQLLADNFAGEVGTMPPARMREYRNAKLLGML